MKALVYHGPGERAGSPSPTRTSRSRRTSSCKIDSTTICGTDLHILKGDVPEVKPGTILGHEAVGTVVETGAAVTTVAEGDRVLVSCITSCGRCRFCKEAPVRSLHRRRRLDLRPPDRRPAGRVRARAVRGHVRLQGPGRADATSRCCSSPTSSRPRTRSACSTAASSPATRSRSSAPARSASPRS